ncbi:DUF5057 domain-containing protein [uncultured Clostridium sp.]|uniref:DUF5057 domain-containing protein n=1 Tax=uncultured Clostridium sp. TaxID=59620 RepID=UPI0025E639B1|nr:DUF5057 domain-containing protein [uncultured Clostridium sp.]
MKIIREDKKIMIQRLSVIMVIMLIVSFIYMVPREAKADNIINYKDEIRILEIEPANDFLLVSSEEKNLNKDIEKTITITDPNDSSITTSAAVSIKTVNMPQFISMVDEINGDYDVVVIGRKNDNISTDKTTGNYLKYSDYTAPFQEGMKREFLPLGSWVGKIPLNTAIDGKEMTEYYPENDITNKNAQKIIDMVDSGQLVYLDNKIKDVNIQKTKLYKNFADKQGINLKIFNCNENYSFNDDNTNNKIKEISLERIVQDYLKLDSAYKRPKIKSLTKPNDDKNIDNASYSNRSMNFNVTVDSFQEEDLKLDLYLDVNGDGIFKDTEIAKKTVAHASQGINTYNLNYRLNNDFIGYLDWKIEVTKPNGIKYNVKNSNVYKRLGSQREIKVLQICPDNAINDSKFNLTKNTEFIKKLKEVDDYNIVVETKKVSVFNDEASQRASSGGNQELNGKYNMIILGFADSYGGCQINKDACNELERYIETGQSVMFTHDTITPALSNNKITLSNGNKIDLASYTSGPRLLTQRMRDYVGQSRYGDPYRKKDDGTIDEFDIYKEYVQGIGSTVELTNKNIPHDIFDKTFDNKKVYTLGATQDGYIREVQRQNNKTKFTVGWDFVTNVKDINSAQINNYPFELSNSIPVAQTHTQWYQLNLEDPDVVPWLNLTGGNFNDSDSRNYYYTYSKGNITYSGTGHSNGFTNEELELFVNTIVKAERGANHAPEIECSIPIESKDNNDSNNIVAGADYSFTVDARDFDGDPVELKIKIGNNDLTSDYVDMSKLEETACFLRKDDGDSELESNVFHVQSDDNDRKALKITIPKNRLSVGQEVVVEINGQDYRGAKVSKKYVINPIELPKFDVSVNLDTDNLRKTVNPSLLDKMDDKTVKVTPGDIVSVPYDVNMREIEYGEVRETSRKEVAILVDTSVSDGNLKTQFKNGIVNELINTNIILNNNTTEDNGRFLMIAYGSDEVKRVESSGGNNYREKLQLSVYKLFDDINQGDMSNKEPQLANAINEAINFFDESNWNDSSKDIIIISNRDINESSVNSIRGNIKDNYNVITLDISEDAYDEGNDNYTEQEHIELLNGHKNLRKVHSLLGGLDNNYFISRTEKKGQTTHNDIANKIFAEIAKHIGYLKYPTFTIDNMFVNFNFGSDITYIEDSSDGFNKKNDNEEDYNYIVNLPKIKYVTKMDGSNKPVTNNGKLVYEPSFVNDNFVTDGFDKYRFEFKISAKNYDKDYCYFASPNELSYEYLGYNTFVKKDVDKTPVLAINNHQIDHGIYKKITGGKAEFDDSVNKYPIGSVVTCASNITQMVNSKDLSIIIDPDLEFVKTPKIYKVDSKGELQPVANGDYSRVSDNQYSYYGFDGAVNNSIVVLYSVKLKSKQGDSYVNISKAGNKEARVSILKKTESEQLGDLPDLF